MKIVDGTKHIDEIKALLVEYVQSLGRDLSFQNVANEYADLKIKYAEPNGRILCALADDGMVVGCVAFHKHSEKRCEMKRLYVKPEYRKHHVDRVLIEEILKLAKQDGYKEMVLDTIKPLESTIHLYKLYDFEETEAYYNNPMDDVIYMKKNL